MTSPANEGRRRSTLFGRLALTLFLSFVVVGIFASLAMMRSSQEYQYEISQRMHQQLAAHVAHEHTLIEKGVASTEELEAIFHYLMILGPSFEFYLLDNDGHILGYSAEPEKIVRQQVDLAPIKKFLATEKIARPILGDDPRSQDRQKIFSATEIVVDDKSEGYLYVIIGGEIYDSIADMARGSQILTWGLWVLIAGLGLSLLFTLLITGIITSPLRRLTTIINQLRQQGFERLGEGHNSVAVTNYSTREISSLASAFAELLERLKDQYDQIKTVDELRRELLSHVSHDLRTPLASLLGYLETWEMREAEMSAEESRKHIAVARSNAEKISNLVEQLFELAHLDSGNVQVNLEQFAIAELVEDVLQKFRIEADKKHVVLSVEPRDHTLSVVGDIEKLDRVFSNLIDNALRHCKEGGSVTVRLSKESRMVSVDVTDTGIGIPESDIPFVFDPHYKAGNSVRGNTAHGGLGLAITKKLLALHQSNISVQSIENQGTTFGFSLRAA